MILSNIHKYTDMQVITVFLLAVIPLPMMVKCNIVSADQTIIVDAHNEARRQTDPSAADMLIMRWNQTLATAAQSFAEQCTFKHSTRKANVGENLYWIGMATIDYKSAIEYHASEKQYYTYSGNSCSSVCGHYTQVAWAKTHEVGCGVKVCNKENVQTSFLVCQYYPAGNLVGALPYKYGPRCAACPNDCTNDLCNVGTVSESYVSPPLPTSMAPAAMKKNFVNIFVFFLAMLIKYRF